MREISLSSSIMSTPKSQTSLYLDRLQYFHLQAQRSASHLQGVAEPSDCTCNGRNPSHDRQPLQALLLWGYRLLTSAMHMHRSLGGSSKDGEPFASVHPVLLVRIRRQRNVVSRRLQPLALPALLKYQGQYH